MHTESISKWQHTHIFGQDQIRSGERRTLVVIIITGLMMVAEIVTGLMYGSMALFADGIHMGSHMVGLGISFIAYIYARRHAHDRQFSFGTGKRKRPGRIFERHFPLIVIALYMAFESFSRFINPVDIVYNQAILVAFIGLVVNGPVSSSWARRATHTKHEQHEHTMGRMLSAH
jgi:cation diffusion facilitator family transporter